MTDTNPDVEKRRQFIVNQQKNQIESLKKERDEATASKKVLEDKIVELETQLKEKDNTIAGVQAEVGQVR